MHAHNSFLRTTRLYLFWLIEVAENTLSDSKIALHFYVVVVKKTYFSKSVPLTSSIAKDSDESLVFDWSLMTPSGGQLAHLTALDGITLFPKKMEIATEIKEKGTARGHLCRRRYWCVSPTTVDCKNASTIMHPRSDCVEGLW